MYRLINYLYFRESPLMENPKTLRSLIKNIGGGSSPILHRKSLTSSKKPNETSSNETIAITKRTCTKGRVNSLSKEIVGKRSMSCDSRLTRKRDFSIDATAVERKTKDKIESNYILLSQVSKKHK